MMNIFFVQLGITPLIYACDGGVKEIFEDLILRGADTTITNKVVYYVCRNVT